MTGPSGLQADGADVAMFDVEVVDANGERCPTDEGPVDFTMTGPGIWRGGYSSGVVGSINKLNLLTEAGIGSCDCSTKARVHALASRSATGFARARARCVAATRLLNL